MEVITIRRATEADAPDLLRLGTMWVDEAVTYGLAPEDERHYGESIGPCCFVAERDGRVVAYVLASMHASRDWCIFPDDLPYVELDELYVEPTYRDSGIGGRLVEACLAAARASGARAASVYSATKDIHSVMRFYEAHGFKSWFIRMFQDLEPHP